VKEPELVRGFRCLVDIGSITDQECSVLESGLKILDKIHRSRKAQMVVSDPSVMKDYLRFKYGCLEREFFMVFFLNSKHQILKEEEILFKGTVDSSLVWPAQIAKRALQLNSFACIIFHNHPSGCVSESRADRTITDRVVSALALLDIKVLDHFVVGAGEVLSFAERGLL